MDHNRLIGLSLNLTDAPFEGGLLQIREWNSGRIVHQAANTGPGDAILFQIADHLEHRVTEVTSTVPKVALAGWFVREPKYNVRPPTSPSSVAQPFTGCAAPSQI